MNTAISSWSGGKDSCFACYLALTQGYRVTHLVNFISQEYRRVSFHGTKAHLISRQAEAIGIPLAQYTVPPDMSLYEQRFKKAVSTLKRRGTGTMVFGDIHLQEHRDWLERVTAEVGIQAVLPLWGKAPGTCLTEFIEAGFETVVISAKASIFGKEWLGRKIDQDFLNDLKDMAQISGIDLCGEQGEYHTIVIDGPLFKKRMEVTYGERVQRDGHWFLDIPRCRLRSK